MPLPIWHVPDEQICPQSSPRADYAARDRSHTRRSHEQGHWTISRRDYGQELTTSSEESTYHVSQSQVLLPVPESRNYYSDARRPPAPLPAPTARMVPEQPTVELHGNPMSELLLPNRLDVETLQILDPERPSVNPRYEAYQRARTTLYNIVDCAEHLHRSNSDRNSLRLARRAVRTAFNTYSRLGGRIGTEDTTRAAIVRALELVPDGVTTLAPREQASATPSLPVRLSVPSSSSLRSRNVQLRSARAPTDELSLDAFMDEFEDRWPRLVSPRVYYGTTEREWGWLLDVTPPPTTSTTVRADMSRRFDDFCRVFSDQDRASDIGFGTTFALMLVSSHGRSVIRALVERAQSGDLGNLILSRAELYTGLGASLDPSPAREAEGAPFLQSERYSAELRDRSADEAQETRRLFNSADAPTHPSNTESRQERLRARDRRYEQEAFSAYHDGQIPASPQSVSQSTHLPVMLDTNTALPTFDDFYDMCPVIPVHERMAASPSRPTNAPLASASGILAEPNRRRVGSRTTPETVRRARLAWEAESMSRNRYAARAEARPELDAASIRTARDRL